jgi:type IV pilus assembly protein PilO
MSLDINDLDFNQIGSWPLPAKLFITLLLCAGVAYGGYHFFIEEKIKKLDEVVKEEDGLRIDFENKQAKAVNLEKYRQQLEDMQQAFDAMKRQLPNRTEVASLLVDISQTGLAAGLEFNLFEPSEEVPQEFYAELPIKIVVDGTYHEFGHFISGLASLPRIVTIHDIQIAPPKQGRGSKAATDAPLRLQATAKTYRYLDEEDEK